MGVKGSGIREDHRGDMPTSFKRPKTIIAYERTPEAELVFCSVCGGLNALGNVAVNIECDHCGGTGYDNKWTPIYMTSYYQPGAVKRWNPVAGGITYLGQCSVKVDARWRGILNNCDFVEMDGVQWNFLFNEDPGEAMGQSRLILALTRKD